MSCDQVYTKTVDNGFRSLWLATQSVNIRHYWFTSSSSERATPNSRKLRAKCLPGLLPKQTKKFHNSSSKLFPKCTKKVTKFGWEVLTSKDLSFWLEFIDKTGKKFFVYKCKLSLSLALLYFVDLLVNKLKTKFNNLFYQANSEKVHRRKSAS